MKISDKTGDNITSKIDLGVHKLMELSQEEYCFDIAFSESGANLLINTKEQMITEKLRSLLRFGTLSTRYKDIFDIWYLIKNIEKIKLMACFNLMIFQDVKMRENNIEDVLRRLTNIFADENYTNRLMQSGKNWTDADEGQVIRDIITFLETL